MEKLNNVLLMLEENLGAVFILLILVITSINIVLRYFFFYPIIWAEELSIYLFVWISFISAAFATAKSKHIRFELIENIIPYKLKNMLITIINMALIIIFLSFFYSSIKVIPYIGKAHGLRVSEAWFFMILPLSCLLFIYHIIRNSVRNLTEHKRKIE